MKIRSIYFIAVAVLLLGLLIFLGVKYLIDEGVFKTTEIKEKEEIDNTIVVGTFIDDIDDGDTVKSTVTFNSDKKFGFIVNTCSGTIELDGTYELEEFRYINLTFNPENENYNKFVKGIHEDDKFEMDATGSLKYIGNGFGCSPTKDSNYMLKND